MSTGYAGNDAEELERGRAMGGVVWRVVRPGAGAPGEAGTDVTETALKSMASDRFDRVIANDGTLDDLDAAVRKALTGS